jgi:DNA polymerase III psi subunit
MVKVTITIDGTPDELPGALRQLLRGADAEPVVAASPDAAARSDWTLQELVRLWDLIRPDARQFLAEIARRPDGCSFDEVQRALGLGGPNVAGRLSSVGRAQRQFPGKPALVAREARTRQYRMDPVVASAFRLLWEGENSPKTKRELMETVLPSLLASESDEILRLMHEALQGLTAPQEPSAEAASIATP